MKSHTLRKPTATIHIANIYSSPERKLKNICLWQGQQDNYNNYKPKKYRISVDEVMALLGSSSKNQKWLKDDILKGLTSKTITWNILKADKTQEWGICTFLAGGTINNGYLEYQYNPLFLEKIKDVKVWANFRLVFQRQLKKRHTIALYEYLVNELKQNQETIIKTSLSDLRLILNLNEDKYKEYKFFNQFVLKEAKKEINKNTDIEVDYQGLRHKRKIAHIQFTTRRKEFYQLPLEPPMLLKSAIPPGCPDAGSEDKMIYNLLLSIGVSENEANRIVENYDPERILVNVEYVKDQIAKGNKIKNFAAYAIQAIKKSYCPAKSPESTKKEMKTNWKNFRQERAREYFKECPPAVQKEMENSFRQWLEIENNKIVLNFYHSNGFDSKMVADAFFENQLVTLLKEPEELDFEKYCAWHQRERYSSLLGKDSSDVLPQVA